MDYLDSVRLVRHASWADFTAMQAARAGRLVLLTTKADTPFTEFRFRSDDTLLVGRESAGVPASVHQAADAAVLQFHL